jgi:hypothetical protein
MFKKLFIKRIGLRVDDQIKGMNDEIMNIEREFKTRLTKPHKQFLHFKRQVQEENTIDDTKIIEEKNEKVNKKDFNETDSSLFFSSLRLKKLEENIDRILIILLSIVRQLIIWI